MINAVSVEQKEVIKELTRVLTKYFGFYDFYLSIPDIFTFPYTFGATKSQESQLGGEQEKRVFFSFMVDTTEYPFAEKFLENKAKGFFPFIFFEKEGLVLYQKIASTPELMLPVDELVTPEINVKGGVAVSDVLIPWLDEKVSGFLSKNLFIDTTPNFEKLFNSSFDSLVSFFSKVIRLQKTMAKFKLTHYKGSNFLLQIGQEKTLSVSIYNPNPDSPVWRNQQLSYKYTQYLKTAKKKHSIIKQQAGTCTSTYELLQLLAPLMETDLLSLPTKRDF